MNYYLILIYTALLLLSCSEKSSQRSVYVTDNEELNAAINQSSPGDEIILSNGIWKDVQIKFYGMGTDSRPIILRAEDPGKVFIEGISSLQLGGEHLIVRGLYFRNGHSPGNSIISFKTDSEITAFHSRVTQCVIEDFTKPSRLTNDRWIEFYGRYNMLDHCYIAGKSNDGETIRVFQDGNQHTRNYHQIVHNYFGPRPRKGGPRAETLRIGDSKTHMTPGYVNVSDNYFEACNGEVEIISDKTNFNTFKKNIFFKCEGSLVLRHGSFATVDGNIFIGGRESEFYGGIRVINTGHWITNNYFYQINGSAFRSPLAIMNGIPKSQLNRYRQVTDVVVAHNTWVDCNSPWQIGVGQNMKSQDVLPEVEIRSAPPIRSIIANNLIFNNEPDNDPVINHHDIQGISFRNNVLDNNGLEFEKYGALDLHKINMNRINDWLYVPEEDHSGILGEVYNGFDFDKIKYDLFGNSRADQNYVGAVNHSSHASNFKIDKSNYGPVWFSTEERTTQPTIHFASSMDGELSTKINRAQSGDIIELEEDVYPIDSGLKIDKEITIRTKGEGRARLEYRGPNDSPLFEMNPGGIIHLENVSLKGDKYQMVFAPLDENMSSAYNIFINNCVVEDFAHILKASKGSFADTISANNTIFQNCENGIVLAADAKGDYNAEMVTFKNCQFINIANNVIFFYRGGYDESTIGGYLRIVNSRFSNCGSKEGSGVLIKTPGIINVFLKDNVFRNNPVAFAAVLWGAKNNHHENNQLQSSGTLKVEEQQKLEILY